MSERIVHLDRLTSREVGAQLKNNDCIFIPHGPISGHGAYVTLGMHCHGAHAFAVVMAQKSGGLVYPPIYQAYAGATTWYPGTVPLSYDFQIQTLKTVAKALYNQGFGRIFLVSFTNPEIYGARIAACDLFHGENEMPVAAMCATDGLKRSEKVQELLKDYDGLFSEAILDYAALKILGHEREIAEPEMGRAWQKDHHDHPDDIMDIVKTMRGRCYFAFRYLGESGHNWHGTVGRQYQGKPDIALGLQVFAALGDYFLPAVEALAEFRDYLRAHPPKWIEPGT